MFPGMVTILLRLLLIRKLFFAEIDDGWEQLYVNYTPETSGTYLMVLCQRNCGKSQIAFDDVQLETEMVASSYNLAAERRYDI